MNLIYIIICVVCIFNNKLFSVEPDIKVNDYCSISLPANLDEDQLINYIPSSFGIDSMKYLYIPNGNNNFIGVYNGCEKIKSVDVNDHIIKIKIFNNNIYVQTSSMIKIYNLISNKVVQLEIPNGTLTDFVLTEKYLNMFLSRYNINTLEYEYWFCQYDLLESTSKDVNLCIQNVNQPINSISCMVQYDNRLIIPAENGIYSISLDSIQVKKINIRDFSSNDAIIYFSKEQIVTCSMDGDLKIKIYDNPNSTPQIINLVPILEKTFGGVYGYDFMFGHDGYLYDVKYLNGEIIILGANKSHIKVISLQIN